MDFAATCVLYCIVGIAVAFAVHLAETDAQGAARRLALPFAALFWPLYLPQLLVKNRSNSTAGAADIASPGERDQSPDDELSHAIAQVELELRVSLRSLDGWAEGVLSRELPRIEELLRAWKAQAARIREMDGFLARSPARSASWAGLDLPDTRNERTRKSEESRARNVQRLERARDRARDELLGTLAWVRELVSMIQLARFTGAPPSRAEELVSQIAASVEGLAAVSGWE